MKSHQISVNILLFILLCFEVVHCICKDIYPSKSPINNIQNEEKEKSNKGVLLLSIGVNISSYLFEDGDWDLGYNFGLTFNIRLFKKLFITLPFSYTRINASPKNIEGYFYSYSPENYIFKMFKDYQISIDFLEFPILLNYKFYKKRNYNFSILFGPGLIISVKDYSKTENSIITDEIIGTYDTMPVDPHEFITIANSGLNFNTGIRFNISRFYFDLVYSLCPYTIKEINKLNSISLNLGVDLE